MCEIFLHSIKIRSANCKKYVFLQSITKALKFECVQACWFLLMPEVLFAPQNIETVLRAE